MYKVNCNEETCSHNNEGVCMCTEITLQTTPEGLECTEFLMEEEESIRDHNLTITPE